MVERTWDSVFVALDEAWKVRPSDLGRRVWRTTLAGHEPDVIVDAILTWSGKQPPRAPEVRSVLLGAGDRKTVFVWDVANVERIVALGDDAYTEGFFARARDGLQVLSPAARRRWASRLSVEMGTGEAA